MKLRLILGDQLNIHHSWYESVDDQICYVMMELRQETDYALHHIQKVTSFFLAMRAFAEQLQRDGHRVIYQQLSDPNSRLSLAENLNRILQQESCDAFEYQLPDEYRLDEQLRSFAESLPIETQVADTEHFLSTRNGLKNHFEGKKMYLMESFYRMMRKKYDVLMDGIDPVTGKWNYDASNRKKLPKDHRPVEPKYFQKDVSEVVEMIENSGAKTIGSINAKDFIWPVTREEGMEMLDFFVEECLPRFGDFQDAMTTEYWSVYHSRLSFLMNAKIISPLEVIQAVENKWREDQEHAEISQVEGFIRQILGWREYMRGIYWAKMPEYAELNFFEHDRKLPDWFWTGDTKMKCLQHSIKQSLEYSYAHHIQRLMVTGNFALLAGIHPDEVDQWYLGIYIDAIEWVEITNTRGMSQFADGGIVGTKPYVSSANYMKKMGNYCDSCFYSQKEKTGERSCPFNTLYWHFYDRHREKLARNPRIGMMYRTWDKMVPERKAEILEQADKYLQNIESL